MSNTIRIYNRKNLKKTPRYNLDDPRYTGDLKTMVEDNLIIPAVSGMPLTHKSQICMGNCSFCKDPGKNQKRQRKIRKREFEYNLSKEMQE